MRPIAPVEYIIISFPGSQFTGEIAPAIADLVASGTVRILDLVFIKRDIDGVVTSFEYDDLPETSAFAEIDGDADGFMSEEDILDAAEILEPGSSAMMIIWEDLWAARLGEAIRSAGGVIIDGHRLPHEAVVAALTDIENEGDH